MVLEGRITVSEYFADVTLKKQTAVSTLLQFQVLVADFILVSFFVLPITTRLPTRRSRYIACITYGSHIGGFALSPLWYGSVTGVCSTPFSQANRHLIVVFSLELLFDLGYAPRQYLIRGVPT